MIIHSERARVFNDIPQYHVERNTRILATQINNMNANTKYRFEQWRLGFILHYYKCGYIPLCALLQLYISDANIISVFANHNIILNIHIDQYFIFRQTSTWIYEPPARLINIRRELAKELCILYKAAKKQHITIEYIDQIFAHQMEIERLTEDDHQLCDNINNTTTKSSTYFVTLIKWLSMKCIRKKKTY